MKANDLLQQAIVAIGDRAKERDTEQGERSMDLAVRIFNAITGKSLSEADGWLFMVALKIARSRQGGHKDDDYVDMAGYVALLGECKSATTRPCNQPSSFRKKLQLARPS